MNGFPTEKAEIFPDYDLMEGMISFRSAVGGIRSGISDRKIEKVWFDREKTRQNGRHLSFIRAMSHELGFEIEYADRSEIDSLASGSSHGGIIARCTKRHLHPISVGDIEKCGIYYLLDGIEDPYNFGYSLRSLYASGADGIILPRRTSVDSAATVCRSSAGASELMKIYTCDSENIVGLFKSAGYRVACADADNALSMWDADLTAPLLLIIGGEKRGISSEISSAADFTVKIEYGRDFPLALSAASAATVLGFEILRQNRNKT